MIRGCNAAMVNYALTEEMKPVKSIVFFNTEFTDNEIVSASLNRIAAMQGNISISQSEQYRVLPTGLIVKKGLVFHPFLFKDIPGFTPDFENIHDLRKKTTL